MYLLERKDENVQRCEGGGKSYFFGEKKIKKYFCIFVQKRHFASKNRKMVVSQYLEKEN